MLLSSLVGTRKVTLVLRWHLLSLHCCSSRAQRGVTKLKRLLEGEDEPSFDANLYMELYT